MKKKGCLGCGCLFPIIFAAVIIITLWCLYAFLPVGNTFGLADRELFAGETMNTLDIADKSLRKLIRSPIKELGRLGEVEFMNGISLNGLGLADNSLWDIVYGKKIKDLGDVENKELIKDSGLTLKELGLSDVKILNLFTKKIKDLGTFRNYDLSNRLPKGGEAVGGGEGDFTDIIYKIDGLTLETLGFGDYKIIDLFTKKIGEFDKFKNTNLVTFIPEDELPFGLKHSDLPIVVKDMVVKINGLDVPADDLFILEFVSNVTSLKISLPIKDENTVIDEVVDDRFKEGAFNQDEEFRNANNAMNAANNGNANPPTAADGSPIIDENGNVDYSKIFQNPIVFEKRGQLIYKDTELTAIYNDLIEQGKNAAGGAIRELANAKARIVQVWFVDKNPNGSLNVMLTVSMPSSAAGSSADLSSVPIMNMPETLYFSVKLIISADAEGTLTFTRGNVTVDNLTAGLSNVLLDTKVEGGKTLKEFVGENVGEMFITFLNNSGDTGILTPHEGADDTYAFGNIGLVVTEGDNAVHAIYIVTRTASEPVVPALAVLPEAA